MKRKTNNSSIPGNNKSTPNLLSKRTREYQRYVKEQAKQRGNNTFDLQIPGATISSRLKTKVNQNQESVNRISRTLAPLLNGDSPNLNRKLSRQEQRLERKVQNFKRNHDIYEDNLIDKPYADQGSRKKNLDYKDITSMSVDDIL